ncbi:MAG TPA: M28 family peptidase [Pyrinomonadaceae bacterium]|jgi:Zn-dependent M28 family amino/carboxypeptidase
MNVILAALLIALLASSVVPQQRKSAPARINENAVRAHIKYLSDDLLEGRGPGARGGDLAAKYIATQLEALGLKGAGAQGSFFQPVSLVGVKADPQTKLTIEAKERKDARETFKFADEFVAFTGAQTEQVAIQSDLVFVGYGINAPEQKWNDYKGEPQDYRDKILVIMVNDPPATQAEPGLFGGRALTYYGRWTYKFEEAARRGAAGVILLHTDESAGYPWSVVRTSNGSWRFDIARGAGDQTPFLKMRAWMTNEAARRMMQVAGLDLDALRKQAASRDFKPIPLRLQGSINLNSELKRVEAPNVAGVLEGRDAKLRDQYVIYSAHWDHFGIGEPNSKGDRIYNGALDNATGVACVLGIAEALSKLPLNERQRRSILFLLTTAEEQGLLGAEWYARHPLVPLAKTAANVNLDSMNILGVTRDFVPLGAERSSLKMVVETIGREMGLQVGSDPRPEQGSFYRSDHFPFARAGVPSISLEGGKDFVGHTPDWGEKQFEAYNTANYHQPSDEYSDAWNFEGMMQETEIALDLGLRIANMDEMPHFNATDEFASADKNR